MRFFGSEPELENAKLTWRSCRIVSEAASGDFCLRQNFFKVLSGEADAQLAFLAHSGRVDVVVTCWHEGSQERGSSMF